MERIFTVELIEKNKVRIIDEYDLSPWSYNVLINNKWYNLYLESNIIEFPKDVSSYFLMIEDLNKNRLDNKISPTIKVCLDLLELKKLEKIDRINPGSAVVPCMPGVGDVERMEKLEKELNQKQKQLIMLSSKLDNLENLLKKTLGL